MGGFTLNQQDGGGCNFTRAPQTGGSLNLTLSPSGAVSGTLTGSGQGGPRSVSCSGISGQMYWLQTYQASLSGTLNPATGALSLSGTLSGNQVIKYQNCSSGGESQACPADTSPPSYSYSLTLTGTLSTAGSAGGQITVQNIGLGTSGTWSANGAPGGGPPLPGTQPAGGTTTTTNPPSFNFLPSSGSPNGPAAGSGGCPPGQLPLSSLGVPGTGCVTPQPANSRTAGGTGSVFGCSAGLPPGCTQNPPPGAGGAQGTSNPGGSNPAGAAGNNTTNSPSPCAFGNQPDSSGNCPHGQTCASDGQIHYPPNDPCPTGAPSSTGASSSGSVTPGSNASNSPSPCAFGNQPDSSGNCPHGQTCASDGQIHYPPNDPCPPGPATTAAGANSSSSTSAQPSTSCTYGSASTGSQCLTCPDGSNTYAPGSDSQCPLGTSCDHGVAYSPDSCRQCPGLGTGTPPGNAQSLCPVSALTTAGVQCTYGVSTDAAPRAPCPDGTSTFGPGSEGKCPTPTSTTPCTHGYVTGANQCLQCPPPVATDENPSPAASGDTYAPGFGDLCHDVPRNDSPGPCLVIGPHPSWCPVSCHFAGAPGVQKPPDECAAAGGTTVCWTTSPGSPPSPSALPPDQCAAAGGTVQTPASVFGFGSDFNCYLPNAPAITTNPTKCLDQGGSLTPLPSTQPQSPPPVSCTYGSVLPGSQCLTCPDGSNTYAPGSDSQCPPGTSCDHGVAYSPDSCRQCPGLGTGTAPGNAQSLCPVSALTTAGVPCTYGVSTDAAPCAPCPDGTSTFGPGSEGKCPTPTSTTPCTHG